ncbi:MAG: peptidylprolyl isomerase [Acidobacteria bacterium]|nr:peptidylprolyl isomerase [Acidobacteriota bacterium]
MKWFLRLAVTTLGSAAALLAADVQLIEEIIAKVNGDIITRGELAKQRRQIEAELRATGNVPAARIQQALQEREKDILRERIDQLLLVQKGKELNINVDQDFSKYQAELQRRFNQSDPEKFQAFVREQTGMPYEDFRNDWKNGQITQRVVREQVSRSVNIPREELRKYYDEHKTEFVRQERVFLRQILVSTDGKDDAGIAAAEKKAKDLVARARKGERFPELARDNSDAPTAQQGGDMGPWEKGKLREDIEKLVWEKPRNYVTDPIRVPEGFLILRVDEHQKEGQAELEEVEGEITEKFYSQRFQPALRDYLTKLRQEAFLEIKSGWVDTGAAPGKNTAWSDPAQLKPETITKEEVAAQTRRRRLLWAIPIPGTSVTSKPKSSSSKR